MPDLKHSAVLVTGTDRGIGRLCASRLASRGRRVFAGVLDEDAASAWRTEGLAGLEPVLLDVRDPACIASAVSAVESALGGEPLGGLVNNAAVAAPGPLELLSAEQVREVFAVNVLGAVETTRACLPLLRASRGRVVHVGSSAGRLATPMMVSARCRRPSSS